MAGKTAEKDAAMKVEPGIEGTLAYMDFPYAHQQKILTKQRHRTTEPGDPAKNLRRLPSRTAT